MSALLKGVRVWLSGAIPVADDISVESKRHIADFVRSFSAKVFEEGGHILHGSHPSFVSILLEQAELHQREGGSKDCLILGVSRYWSKNPEGAPLGRWRQSCTVYEIPEIAGEDARDKSLEELRRWMAARADAYVGIGGEWWRRFSGRAGVPIEVQLAIAKGLPCFLLGGMGGAATDYVDEHPHVLGLLQNGLDFPTNRKLASSSEAGTVSEVFEQLCRLPLVRGTVSEGSSFRILALDGGGIKGTFTAAALAAWERQTGLSVVDHFDLIAGTSTGGILAIGLGLGMTAQDMLEFYRERGPIIFPAMSLKGKIAYHIKQLFRPKYSKDVLLKEIVAAFYKDGQPRQMKTSKCRLLIPAYHAVRGATHLFRTPHHPILTSTADTDLAQAALATAAAPTYFSAATVEDLIAGGNFFDGGVWANCPAMAAIIEAVCYLDVSIDRIDVLSVGTTEEPFTLRKKKEAGFLGWNLKLLDILMNAQSETAVNHAELLVGHPRFLRVNATVQPGIYTLDDTNQIAELADLGRSEAERPEIVSQIRSRFLNGVPTSPWTSHVS